MLSVYSVNGQSIGGGIIPYSDDADLPSEWISKSSEENFELDYNNNTLIILESSTTSYRKIDLSAYGTDPKSIQVQNGIVSIGIVDSREPNKEISLYFDFEGNLKANISRINPNYIP